jgi:hypothetical protein
MAWIVIRGRRQSGLPRDSKPKHGRIQRVPDAHHNGGGVKENRKVMVANITRSSALMVRFPGGEKQSTGAISLVVTQGNSATWGSLQEFQRLTAGE